MFARFRLAAAALLSLAVASPVSAATAQLPSPTRVTLPNGMTLLVVYRPNLPIVSMNAVVRAGDVTDPAGKAGLASLTADLLKRGTQRRSAPQIAEAIDGVGGALSTGSGADTASVGCNVLTKDVDLGVDLLSDLLLHAKLDAKELNNLREEEMAGLRSELDDADTVARVALKQAVLSGNPYGQTETLRSLKSITQADVRGFYNTYYRPNNTIVAVVGDITPQDAAAKFTAAFGGWKAGAIPARAVAAPAALHGRRVVQIDMDVNQSFVVVGHPAVKRNNPDFFPLTVLNFILGGDFTSRLNMSIRDRQGLAYGASSNFRMLRDAGYFTAGMNTRTPVTAQALTSLFQEIKGIQDTAVTDQELNTAKAYLMGSFPLRFETNEQLSGEIVNIETYGLPPDYLGTYRQRIEAVTAADVQRVARTYLHPGDYDLVVVAKSKDLGNALAPFGKVEVWPKERLIQ